MCETVSFFNSSPGVFLLAAFTANLASFLVAKQEAKRSFGSVREAVAQQKSIVMNHGWPQHEWFEHAYPGYTGSLLTTETVQDIGKKLVNGTYDSALLGQFEIEQLQQDPYVNPKCSLTHVGEPLLTTQGGWMVFQDVETYCTLLVREVLAIWFLRLEMQGALRQMVHESLVPRENCPVIMKSRDAELKPLYIQNVLGILLLHGLGVLVAFFMWGVKAARKCQPESSSA